MGVVVVTGSSGGLGSAAARAFCEAGYEVVGLDKMATAAEPVVRHIEVDVTNEETMVRALRDVGPVQHVVAIAGGALMEEKAMPDIAALPIDVVRRSLEQNLISAFVTLRTAMPKLREASGDRSMTFVTSTDALLSYGLPGYAAAKAGIIGLVRSLASPLGAEGIRVNAIAPGDVPTPRNAREWAHVPDWYERLAASTALRRLCTPEELADAFVSVATQLRGVTGQVLVVDAGLTVSAGINAAVAEA
ncbi:MAG: SDR family NAD(P)-dependent oxidoreductase [Acidimicrobiales bacterium]